MFTVAQHPLLRLSDDTSPTKMSFLPSHALRIADKKSCNYTITLCIYRNYFENNDYCLTSQ